MKVEIDEDLTSQIELKEEIKEEQFEDFNIKNEPIFICPECPLSFQSTSELKSHGKTHSIEKRTCKICKLVLKNQETLETHVNKHLNQKPYECEICKKNFYSKSHLRLHTKTHSTEKKYECETCFQRFRVLDSLRIHSKIHNLQLEPKETNNGKNEEIMCNLCSITFTSDRLFKTHLKTHTELQYPCEHCLRIYETLYKLRKHINRAHILNVCTECNETFVDRAQFTKHKKQHAENKPCECTYCKKLFDKKKNLVEHIRLQHKVDDETVHKCHICTKQFINKSLLKNHVKTHDKTICCNICTKTFASKYNFKLHLVTHTGEKKHKCNICGKSYSTKTSLKNHLASHSDERNFQCDQCPKRFKSNRRLYVHKFSHLTEEKFQCKICDAKFTTKQYLNCHMNKHSNFKPFQCKTCQKRFKHKKSWLKHSSHDRKRKCIKIEKITCEICEIEVQSKTELLEHVRSQHKCNENS